jgi:hypothetical protein
MLMPTDECRPQTSQTAAIEVLRLAGLVSSLRARSSQYSDQQALWHYRGFGVQLGRTAQFCCWTVRPATVEPVAASSLVTASPEVALYC